jgi:hypothetical protein
VQPDLPIPLQPLVMSGALPTLLDEAVQIEYLKRVRKDDGHKRALKSSLDQYLHVQSITQSINMQQHDLMIRTHSSCFSMKFQYAFHVDRFCGITSRILGNNGTGFYLEISG